MKADSKLLIIEAVIKEGKGTDFAKFCDINMLAVTGGRERTEKEWSILLSKAKEIKSLKLPNRFIKTYFSYIYNLPITRLCLKPSLEK